MKQVLITLSFIASTLFGQANDKIGNPSIHAAFQSQFQQAENATWSQVESLTKASFVMDGRAMAAFYDSNGDLIAVTKNLSVTELPESLSSTLKKELDGAWLSELFVMSTPDGDSFFANIENGSSKTVLQSVNGKKWNTLDRKQK